MLDFMALLADRTLHPAIISNIVYLVGYLKVNGGRTRKNKIYY